MILQPALLLVYVRWAYQRTATAFSSAVQWILLPVLALTIGNTAKSSNVLFMRCCDLCIFFLIAELCCADRRHSQLCGHLQ